MTRLPIILFVILLSTALLAQPLKARKYQGGLISLGVRSSVSAFNDGAWNNTSTGVGGQLRVQFSDRVNTDWFMDYFTGNIGDFANRQDLHIGWSVLYYLRAPSTRRRVLQPYVLMGHCFDHSKQTANVDHTVSAERWSSAVQGGAGTHINLSERSDISFVGQYMIHLGTDIHAHSHDGEVAFEQHKAAELEGHLLFHVSFNYKIIDAW
jgi:Outer membrane protein beta-barrel domain